MPAASGKIQLMHAAATMLPKKPVIPRPAVHRPFSDVLKQELKEPTISFSAHAAERMRQRNIFLPRESLVRLSEAVEKAAGKGARDALFLDSNLAYIVSVKNRSVITVMDTLQARDRVFTNIDSAVLL